jgi:hypothetical protein
MDFDDFEVEELLHAEPMDSWGVSYDLFTRRLEDDLPDGWHLYRGQHRLIHLPDVMCQN